MEVINVVAAAIAAWLFGAVWYGLMGKQWMDAVGLKPENIDKSDKKPFIISFVCILLVAGMMRHIFMLSGINTVSLGIMAGFGLGAFIATPWIVMNYTFAGRPAKLMMIDGVNCVVATTIIGIVLTLF